MRRASGIECGTAFRAGVDALVRIDRQFGPAHSAQDRRLVELLARPLLGRVVGRLRVTEMAGEVPVAAEEADRDDVESGPVVDAPRVFVDGLAVDLERQVQRSPAYCQAEHRAPHDRRKKRTWLESCLASRHHGTVTRGATANAAPPRSVRPTSPEALMSGCRFVLQHWPDDLDHSLAA